MSNLPTPYNGDFPEENIDLNLLYIDNAIDVATNPNNVIINNGLYVNTIDSNGSVPIVIGGTNASSITIGKAGISTTINGTTGFIQGFNIPGLDTRITTAQTTATDALPKAGGTVTGTVDLTSTAVDLILAGSITGNIKPTTTLTNSLGTSDLVYNNCYATNMLGSRLDTILTGGLLIGNTTANSITVGKTGITTTVNGILSTSVAIGALQINGSINGNLYPSTALLAVGSSVTPWLSADITTLTSTSTILRNGASNTTIMTTGSNTVGQVFKLPVNQGSANSLLQNNGAGTTSWAMPNIWDYGTPVNYFYSNTNPFIGNFPILFTSVGNVAPTYENNQFVQLTDSIGNQNGIIYFNGATQYNNWEIRARIYILGQADGIWFGCNQPSAPISSDTESTANGIRVFFSLYFVNSGMTIYNGSTTVSTQTQSAISYNHDGFRDIVIRKIGTNLVVIYNDGAGSVSTAQSFVCRFDAPITNTTGSYWSIGARTGGSNARHAITYYELRGYS
jgi:hypothetical protein